MAVRRLYDDNLYQFDTPQQSYWEATGGADESAAERLSKTESCDVAVIGGGFTGLSAALHLARDFSIDVHVLEAGPIGWGASGRNGGFCAVGGSGLQSGELITKVGLDEARAFYRSSAAAVELVRSIAADEEIDLQEVGDGEIEVAHSRRAAAGLERDHEVLTKVLGMSAELVSAAECRERFYDSTESFGAMINRPAFGLHPLRYCRGLAAAAARHGAVLHANSQVVDWAKDGGIHTLSTTGGTLRARRVVYATNGFIQESLNPEFYGRTLPIISSIVVTRPLTRDEIAAQNWRTHTPVFNSRRLLNYFRLLPDRRFLFGGRGSTSGDPSGEEKTHADNIARMRQIWPAWKNIEIDFRWHGLICYTSTYCPTLGHLDDDPSVFFGFGYHGNGVNMATWTGKQLADWIGNGRPPAQLPLIVRGLAGKYPLARLRRRYLQLGLRFAKWRDSRN